MCPSQQVYRIYIAAKIAIRPKTYKDALQKIVEKSPNVENLATTRNKPAQLAGLYFLMCIIVINTS